MPGNGPIASTRLTLSVVLLASGLVILSCYLFAGYLYYRRGRPAETRTVAATPEQRRKRITELVAGAGEDLARKKVEQALIEYREALSIDPAAVDAQLGLARGELAAGREDVAAAEYERVLAIDRTNRTALLALAGIYSHDRSTWSRAEDRYRTYLQHAPDDSEAWLGLGRVLAWEGKPRETAAIFGRKDVAARMTLADRRDYAFALVKAGRSAEAESVIRKLMPSLPDDTELRLQLASLYAARHEWNSAVPIYRAAIARRPHDPYLQYSYGLGLLAMRKYRAALKPLDAARRAMPASGAPGLAYARALKGTGELKDALNEYERVISHYSRDAAVQREYADALLDKRDYRDASKYYGNAYRLGLHDERLLMGYAGALSGERKYKAALPLMEELHRRDPTPRVTFELAKLMQKLGRSDRARELLRDVDRR